MYKDIFDHLCDDALLEEYYMMAIHDKNCGLSLDALTTVLRHYEELQMFLPCAGIKKAIDEIEGISSMVQSDFYNVVEMTNMIKGFTTEESDFNINKTNREDNDHEIND